MTLRVLILGGTGEARALAEQLAHEPRYRVLLSYAGRTEQPLRPDVPCRVGGFGGAAGLAEFLQGFDALVDATHPYAARISHNAALAAERTGVAIARVGREAWRRLPGDRWIEVADMDAAADALGPTSRRVFLTIGRQELAAFERAPQHQYLIRAIEPFQSGLPNTEVMLARGPFSLAQERALLEQARIELLVSKNAGGAATYAKLEAARELQIPVVMVARPRLPAVQELRSTEEALAWLHGLSPRRRGE